VPLSQKKIKLHITKSRSFKADKEKLVVREGFFKPVQYYLRADAFVLNYLTGQGLLVNNLMNNVLTRQKSKNTFD